MLKDLFQAHASGAAAPQPVKVEETQSNRPSLDEVRDKYDIQLSVANDWII